MTKNNITMPNLSVNESETVEQRFTDNAINNILPARYLKKDDNGNIVEIPDGMFERVASKVAEAENKFDSGNYEYWKREFERVMKEQRAMPNSPALMNMGNVLNMGSACFSDSPSDSMEDIFDTAKEWGLIQKTGGGVGGAFHKLRPKGTIVSSTKGKSSGPVSFMEHFNTVAGTVKQGGTRRGAQMAILRVDHADVGRFIVSKRTEGRLANFNISVSVTDEFLDALENSESYLFYDPMSDFEEPQVALQETVEFYSPKFEDSPESIVDENLWRDYADEIKCIENGEVVTLREKWEGKFFASDEESDESSIELSEGCVLSLPAEFIFDLLVDGAWRNGEPGVVHYDEINREHSFDVTEYPEYVVDSTNPCSEQPLVKYESCNLMHINLSLLCKDGTVSYSEYTSKHEYTTTAAAARDYFNYAVDIDELRDVTEVIVRFLDNMIEVSEFPLEEIEQRAKETRKVGVGIMGWAQLLYQMGVTYGTEESLELARMVMSHIDAFATEASHELALERGSFEAWDKSKYASPEKYSEWFRKHAHQYPEEWADGYEMRNHNVTTIAPTGTTSMLADTSGGCEPVYNVAYKKNVGRDIQGDEMLVEFDKVFLKTLELNDIDVAAVKKQAFEQMNSNSFEGVSGLDIPEKVKEIFVTTNDISPEGHVDMQRAFQEFCDSGISKTANAPCNATRGDVADIYMRALREPGIGSPVKGTTVYVDQSREEQVLTTQKHSDKEIETYKEALEEVGYTVIKKQQGEWTKEDVESFIAEEERFDKMVNADD